jgi:hypothetical protein
MKTGFAARAAAQAVSHTFRVQETIPPISFIANEQSHGLFVVLQELKLYKKHRDTEIY